MGTWLKRSTSKKKYIFNHEQETVDQVLEGLFTSEQPDKMKEAVVNRICDQASKANPDNTIRSVMSMSSKWVLHGTTTTQVMSGFKLFYTWGTRNTTNFQSFFTPTLVADFLTQGYGGMAANVPLLIREGFRVMSHTSVYMNLDHARMVQKGITKFISRAQDRVIVRNVLSLLVEFPECIPENENEKTNFCLAVVRHLGVGVPPENEKEIQRYIKYTNEIAEFVSQIWMGESAALMTLYVAEIFSIITTRGEEISEPAICLATLIKYIPLESVNKVVRNILADPSVSCKSIEAAVGQIVEWLKWPTAVNVDHWLLYCLNELAVAQKSALMVRITEINAQQVAENLAYPRLRQASLRVLSYLLLGYQHSPGPFHKVLEKVPIIVHKLRDEGTPQSGAFLKELSELIHDLMYQHSGFPELYEPVLELIKDFPQPSTDEIKVKLNQRRWSSQVNCMDAVETIVLPSQVVSVKQEKLELGKTGLENLGNTCYMNSVLQALYMCDQFRNGVLDKTPAGKESLLAKLQDVFAYLSQSSRPTMAPSKFLQASRPPWFIPGHQQDCSEFLKYLLDQLHEDERSSSSSSGMKTSASSGSISPTGTIKIDTGTLSKAERKKATVMLTAVKMLDEMNGFNFSATANTSNNKCSDPALSLVERTFRGKMQTTMKCLACKQTSSRIESFADIPLAFPNSSRSTEYPQKSLAGGNIIAGAEFVAESTDPEISSNSEMMTESKASFSLDDLISFYLKPEKLTGDNKYHCDKCGRLQDGERSIQIIESPNYLILTLLRFSYDTKLQSRTKIFEDVCYPRTLALPVCDEVSSKSGVVRQYSRNNSLTSSKSSTQLSDSNLAKLEDITKNLTPRNENPAQCPQLYDLYGLSGVIVHSGASSECGHYYCYARHSQAGQVDSELLDQASCELENLDLLPDNWYNFNDSRVSHATFDSFSNVTKRFSKDTAYVLIYRKLGLGDQSFGICADPALRSDLSEEVSRDNEAYLKEQMDAKREEQIRRRSSSVNSASLNTWKSKEEEDDNSPDVINHWF